PKPLANVTLFVPILMFAKAPLLITNRLEMSSVLIPDQSSPPKLVAVPMNVTLPVVPRAPLEKMRCPVVAPPEVTAPPVKLLPELVRIRVPLPPVLTTLPAPANFALTVPLALLVALKLPLLVIVPVPLIVAVPIPTDATVLLVVPT